MKIFAFSAALIISLSWSFLATAQTQMPKEYIKATVTQDEFVSMAASMPFDQALQILSDLCKFRLNKILIDPSKRADPIGVDIDKLHWLDALEMILRHNNMWYTEYQDHILIFPLDQEKSLAGSKKTEEEMYETREVVITAIFFEVNLTRLRQLGFSWNFLSNDVNLNASQSAVDQKTSILQIEAIENYDFGTLTTIFKTLENNQAGEVIASPQIYVMSEEKGQIQVGSDYTVTVKDIAGNTVQQFFSTGSIIEVTPTVIKYDTVSFIYLELMVQKSSATSSEIGIEIKKSEASTSVLLLDAEECLLGGLISNETTETREGVPFLKDLPWWFFGLRYLFGFEATSLVKKELVILIKVDLVPTLNERLRARLLEDFRPKSIEERIQELKDNLEEIKERPQENEFDY